MQNPNNPNKVSEEAVQKGPTKEHSDERLSELGFLPKEKVDESMPNENSPINRLNSEHGKIGWAVLWLLGVPIPILFVLFLLRGCT